MPKEVCGNTVGELVAVDDMHQRKAEMARRAHAFIALPGTCSRLLITCNLYFYELELSARLNLSFAVWTAEIARLEY